MYTPLKEYLEKFRCQIFVKSNSAFLAPLVAGIEFVLTDRIPTAATNGTKILINEKFFDRLDNDDRRFILLHEIWHIARLHLSRRGNRDPMVWNIVTDYVINTALIEDGELTSLKRKIITDLPLNDCSGTEEELYDRFMKKRELDPDFGYDIAQGNLLDDDVQAPEGDSSGDELDGEGTSKALQDSLAKAIQEQAELVAQAYQSAKLCGKVPGDIERIIDQYLVPKLDWRVILRKQLTDTMMNDYSWQRPNRRYPDAYLPSLIETEERLDSLVYAVDASFSMDEDLLNQINTELMYIKKTFKPRKFTVIVYDTDIRSVKVYDEHDKFTGFTVKAGGGTEGACVFEYIKENNLKPQTLLVFSDLCDDSVKELTKPRYPVIWLKYGPEGYKAPFGKEIKIDC